MMEHISKGITNVLIRNSITSEEQKSIVAFGIETAIYKILHLGVAVLIGMMFGKVLGILVFHLFYQKLRTYAGGHHAKSNIVCFICSCGIAVGTLTFWSLCPTEYQIWCTIGFMAVSFPIIWILSPVGAISKPLDVAETAIYRKKARIYLMIETIIVMLMHFIGFGEIALVGATALAVLAIMLVLGKLKSKYC